MGAKRDVGEQDERGGAHTAHDVGGQAPQDDRRPSRLANYSRLLSAAGRLTGAIRDVVERRCDEALESAAVDVLAFDLLASEVRPLGLALLDALQGDQGRASSTQGGARRAH